jgi:alcohol dehydrogenase class IV
MKPFVYTANAARVVFGVGSLQCLEQEIQRLGVQRALLLCTPARRGEAETIAQRLGTQVVGIHDRAVMHVPVESAREACDVARSVNADGVIAFGGGSTTGLGKAIALDSGLPILAIPTTYAGSEMTPIYGLTEGGLKKTGKDPRVLPRTVIYDPELSRSLPVAVSVTSALNAVAHAAEGLYAQDINPIMAIMAEQGIAAIARALPGILSNPTDIDARSQALYGAWMCGTVLGHVGMALHHKLCHALGGSFNLPHAETHAIVLPHAMAYNAVAASEAMARIAHAMGTSDAPGGLYDLARNSGAPPGLKDIGMVESDLERAADIAVSSPYWNPRPVERGAVLALLRNAWEGSRPAGEVL